MSKPDASRATRASAGHREAWPRPGRGVGRAGRSTSWPGACALQSGAVRFVQSALSAVLLAGWMVAALAASAARIEPVPALLAPLDHLPLDPPLRVTGSFGELRGGHFHAGLDFSTGGVTGRPVYAALPGTIERVRTSGAGYGRSLYLHARDGRLIVMAHLDQFMRPIAEYVAAIQDSSGQYEQDLWPAAARFPVKAGQLLGWSGRSGTVPPHLHFEVRRGDVAYNPLRAGIALEDTIAPMIARVTLEPLDDTSFVDRSAAPCTVELGERPDTLILQGRARAIVEVTDGTEGTRRTMAPWSVALEPGPESAAGSGQVECRLDSASWATDMSEVDYVYDRGRITASGRFSMMLWAPLESRPVVLDGDPDQGAIGTLMLRPGERTRRVRIVARDIAGHTSARAIVLRSPGFAERGPAPGPSGLASGKVAKPAAQPGSSTTEPSAAGRFDFVALPGRHLRVVYRGAPAGSRRVWFETGRTPRQPASAVMRDSAGAPGIATGIAAGLTWSAILPGTLVTPGAPATLVVRVGGEDGAGAAWSAESAEYTLFPIDPGAAAGTPPGVTPQWRLPRGGAFESALLLVPPPARSQGAGELVAVGDAAALLPASLPLRRAASVSLALPAGAAHQHVGLFSDSGAGWEFIAMDYDSSSRRVSGETRQLGVFALFDDTRGPRVTPLRAPRHAALRPYSHWALEAKLEDLGSDIDPRASHFAVDGRRMPSEWDGSVGILRWRPLHKPAPGRHHYQVIAVDRTGNVTRQSATFVID